MQPTDNILRDMPDIASDLQAEVAGRLDWVGMNEIELPVRIEDDAGNLIQSTAIVTAYVNLVNPEVRGIHMSRLYLHLDQAFSDRAISPGALRQILKSFLESHEGEQRRERQGKPAEQWQAHQIGRASCRERVLYTV